MKAISEFTYQEKIAQILDYRTCRIERETKLRYLLAIRRNDKEQIAYFESFGDSVHRIIHNVRTYERGLLFGYTSKELNGHGWLVECCQSLRTLNWNRAIASISGSPSMVLMP